MRIRLASSLLLAFSLHAAHLVYNKAIPASPLSVDASGNVYVIGVATITKLDPGGNLIYAKPLSVPATPVAMAVDLAGNVVIAGNTNSDSLPTTPGVFQPKRSPGVCITGDKAAAPYPCPDAFIAKIDRDGNLAWASYLGGLGIDQANGVAVDPAGNVYVTGFTQSGDFPSVNAFQPRFGGYADAFVTKISPDGTTILYSSFLGGSGYDVAHAIAVDAGGNAYVAGELQGDSSTNAFLAKVSPAGDDLVFSESLGAAGFSTATAVSLDRQGNVYVGGSTNSRTFSATPNAYNGAGNSSYINFLQKYAPDGSILQYSALFDGGVFGVYTIAVDSSGSAYLTGEVDSNQFPSAGPAMQPCPAPFGLVHYFLLKVKADGSAPLYSSFEEQARLALAPDGSLYLGGASSLRKLTVLELPGDSFLSPSCVLNGASFSSHLDYGQPGISPGEIVTLKGTGLGPASPSLAGTQVFFDGVAAPLLYAQDAQINVVAPYSLTGKTQTEIQVRYQGQTTDAVTLPVAATSAAIFRNIDGTPLILNQDYSVNAQSNPAPRGSTLILYTTGAGQTDPPSQDGQIWQTTGGLQAPVAAQLTNYGSYGTVTAMTPVTYAGPVPKLISAVQQFNIQIPAGLPDSFVTEPYSVGSAVNLQIGAQQLGFSVYVR